MKTIPWEKNIPEINTRGIDSFVDIYLKKIGESSIDDLSLSKAEQLFVFVIEDFKNGTFSSDDLADFGEKIFHAVAKHNPKSDLFQASLSASELVFSVRSNAVYENVPGYLKDVDDFYDKHK